jgi:voltage-gated potassium channel Kch
MNSALFLALRRMRAPLIVLIVAYAVSILGMVLVPGVDGQGMPWRVSFFHAFYFVSYTATTIGFGEIPYAFTDAQRMWVTATIYITVVAWFYALGKILQIMQDPAFQHVLAAGRFGRAVHGLREPFFIVCGFGETGGELVEAFDHRGVRAVVVDLSPARVGEVELVDLLLDVPALVGDVRTPETLVLAGLRHPKCAGLVALTNDDQANLAVAATARLLRPGLPVVCRCESEQTAKSMAAFGVDQVIDPFALFGVHLATALRKPGHFLLREWLTAAPDELSREPLFPPTGRWVLCGFGRFGTRTAMGLELAGNTVTIIDSDPEVAAASGLLCGHGTERDRNPRCGRAHRRDGRRRDEPVDRADRSPDPAGPVRRGPTEPAPQRRAVRGRRRDCHRAADDGRRARVPRLPDVAAARALSGVRGGPAERVGQRAHRAHRGGDGREGAGKLGDPARCP